MNETMQLAVRHIAANMTHEQLVKAATDNNLYDYIVDLLEEYGDDNDLPEGWWMNVTDDIEEIAHMAQEYQNN